MHIKMNLNEADKEKHIISQIRQYIKKEIMSLMPVKLKYH